MHYVDREWNGFLYPACPHIVLKDKICAATDLKFEIHDYIMFYSSYNTAALSSLLKTERVFVRLYLDLPEVSRWDQLPSYVRSSLTQKAQVDFA